MFPPKTRALIGACLLALCTAGSALAAGAVEAVSTAPDAVAKPAAVVVTIDKMKYAQPEVKIKAGESVTWTNLEVMPHNVHFQKADIGAEQDLMGSMLTAKQSYTVKFNKAGTYAYHCTPHPFMRGKVIVE